MGSALPVLDVAGMVSACDLVGRDGTAREMGWRLAAVAGRMVEVAESESTASLTAAAWLIHEAQTLGEPVVWIGSCASIFFPPDFVDFGIDLEALPVVRVADGLQAAKAADTVMRSGGVGLVIVDLGSRGDVPLAAQTRLAGLAKKHRTALVFLTRMGRLGKSLGPLVSLRGSCTKTRTQFDRFSWAFEASKDKHHATGWRHEEICHGPDGLC